MTTDDFPNDDALLWYLAGIFDGEGCVTASISKIGRGAIECKVAMTDLATVQLFQDRFPSYILSEKPKTERYSTLYRWAVAGRPALPFLREMATRCGLKRKAIIPAIEYFESINGRRTSHEVKLRRLKLLVDIRSSITRSNSKPIPQENIDAYLAREFSGCPRPVIDGKGNRFNSRTEAAEYYGTTSQCISSAITHGSICRGTSWHDGR
jgi:hypothetical protein